MEAGMNAHVKPRTGMHLQIVKLLHDGPMASNRVAVALRQPLHGVESSMRAMQRHGEVVRLAHRPGRWAEYKLTESGRSTQCSRPWKPA